MFILNTKIQIRKGDIRMNKNKERDDRAKKIVNWLNTNKEEIEKDMEQTDKVVTELKKSREIDCRTLHIPFGPIRGQIWPHQRI